MYQKFIGKIIYPNKNTRELAQKLEENKRDTKI